MKKCMRILAITRKHLRILILIPGFVAIVGCASNTGYSHLPNCTADVNCLASINWKAITPAQLQVMIDAGAKVNTKGEDDRTSLHEAAKAEKSELIPVLLEAGASVHARTTEYGLTPLHLAKEAETVSVLVKAGADVNAKKAEYRRTPLHFAKEAEAVSTLVKAGAEVNAKDIYGLTPLHVAQESETISALVKAGADVNAKSKGGWTPLHSASSAEAVSALVKAGADVNAKSKTGWAPLHSASSAEVISILVHAGADINAQAKNGLTPLGVAKRVTGNEGRHQSLGKSGCDNAYRLHGRCGLPLEITEIDNCRRNPGDDYHRGRCAGER